MQTWTIWLTRCHSLVRDSHMVMTHGGHERSRGVSIAVSWCIWALIANVTIMKWWMRSRGTHDHMVISCECEVMLDDMSLLSLHYSREKVDTWGRASHLLLPRLLIGCFATCIFSDFSFEVSIFSDLNFSSPQFFSLFPSITLLCPFAPR
jgi:hypothetical protein